MYFDVSGMETNFVINVPAPSCMQIKLFGNLKASKRALIVFFGFTHEIGFQMTGS